MNRQVFKNIKIDLVIDNVYRQLGFWNETTIVSKRQRNDIECMMYEALDYLDFSAVAATIDIVDRDSTHLSLASGQIFKSEHLASVFKNADGLLLMGASAGDKIIDIINVLSEDNLTKATVYNAVAGEMVDDVFNWLMTYYRRLFRRNGMGVSKNRYSAGYGDFSLEYQKEIYELLMLDELGISITSSYMLKPEKSVTAIAGILKHDNYKE